MRSFMLADDPKVESDQHGATGQVRGVGAGITNHGFDRVYLDQGGEPDRNPSKKDVAIDGSQRSDVADATSQLRERARAQFLKGRGKPTESGMAVSVASGAELTLGVMRERR